MKKEGIILVILVVALASSVSAQNAPTIQLSEKNILLCEGQPYAQSISVSDADSEEISLTLSESNPLFVRKIGQSGEQTAAQLFSKNLTKDQTNKNYSAQLIATDGNYAAQQNLNIRTVEINNPPKIQDVKSQTFPLSRSSFLNITIKANDTEDGDQDSGNLSFNLNFISGEPFLEITNDGIIEKDITSEDIGVYLIEACVRDRGIEETEYSNYCDENGEAKRTCDQFQLTITQANRPPTITTSSPVETEINSSTDREVVFEITTFDPDGSKPDVTWFYNGVKKEFDPGFRTQTYSFATFFECEDVGEHQIKVEVSDGLLSDSITWNYDLVRDNCQSQEETTPICSELWGCENWNECQHAKQSLNYGTIPQDTFDNITEECEYLGIPMDTCGFQFRNCFDVNSCGTDSTKPSDIRACQFTINPSCSDNILNCHDGECEILVDCGGPCQNCPTCTDGIKNQGEEDIDCGGPCNQSCRDKEPLIEGQTLLYGAYALIAILIIVVIIKLIHVIMLYKKYSEEQ